MFCSLLLGIVVAGGCSREPAPETPATPQAPAPSQADPEATTPVDEDAAPDTPGQPESHSQLAVPPPTAIEAAEESEAAEEGVADDEAAPAGPPMGDLPGETNSTPNPPPSPETPSTPEQTSTADTEPASEGDADEDAQATVDPRPLQAPDRNDPDDLLKADSPPPASGRSPEEVAAEKAFAAPGGAKQLAADARLWVDPDQKRLIVDGYVTLREGPLEMFACPVGTKEHESIVSVLSQARYVHAGLLAVGAMPGTPVSFVPEYRPATGQRIAIWVMWRDDDGEIQKVSAQQWVQQTGTDEQLQVDWVFAGSSFWRDPETGREYYQADSGDLVCVSNFSTATLDLPVESSQSNAALQYAAFTERIPPRGTPVRLVFVPIPLPSDDPQPTDDQRADHETPPEDALLAAPAEQ